MRPRTPGTVYLVGAGPGDPDLLTVKAHHLLRQCDALVYDSLVPQQLLDLTSTSCSHHFVGKRRGHHSVPQRATNDLLLELAARHPSVVRLKGGDPFLFGRGGEEAAGSRGAGRAHAGNSCGFGRPAFGRNHVEVVQEAEDEVTWLQSARRFEEPVVLSQCEERRH